jgi:hypothetical protein
MAGKLAAVFTHIEREGHAFWRGRISGFRDLAQGFCDRMHTAGGGGAAYDF